MNATIAEELRGLVAAGYVHDAPSDGSDVSVARAEVERMAEISRSLGASQVQVATSAAERDKLWQARRSVSAALGRLRPNKLGEDIVVPKSEIPAMIDAVREIAATYRLPIPVFGHAGDGNLHPNILFDLRDPDEVQRVELAARDLFRAALRLGGTLSGEHGVGTLKREFLEEAHGPLAVTLARGINKVFDPHDLLNPGKVFPTGRGTVGFLSDLPTLQGATPG
jgi:glycolate oxidase